MSAIDRRSLIKRMAATGLISACSIDAIASATTERRPKAFNRITGVSLPDSTIRRIDLYTNGFRSTWTSDDRQLISVHEGTNLDKTESYTSCIFALEGDPTDFRIKKLPGYPHMQLRIRQTVDEASYWGGDCLAIGDTIYQFLTTVNHAYVRMDGSFWPGFRTMATKVIYSPDNGVTWHNQDGSTPVIWENWNARSKDNMLFYDEEVNAGRVLQMGKAYAANKDGYVYMYVNGRESPLSELSVLRVPKSGILQREAYECFAGRLANGDAAWTRDIGKRAAVHRFPEGWVATHVSNGMLAAGWNESIFYNEPLGVYVMVAQGIGTGDDGGWFGRPSYLGFWVAAAPWGPFRQVHEETAWTPNGDRAARAVGPVVAPKWVAPDGRSFWFIWGDRQYKAAAGEPQIPGAAQNPDAAIVKLLKDVDDDREFTRVFVEFTEAHQSKAIFGYLQRVDLIME